MPPNDPPEFPTPGTYEPLPPAPQSMQEAFAQAAADLAGALPDSLMPIPVSGLIWSEVPNFELTVTGVEELPGGPFSVGGQLSSHSLNHMHADIEDGKKRIANLENQVLCLQRLIEGIVRRVGIDRFAEIVKDIEYDVTPDPE